MEEEADDRILAGHLRRSEQYRSWLARTRQTIERAKDRPAPYTLPRQISLGKPPPQVDLLTAVLNSRLDEARAILETGSVDPNITDTTDGSSLLLLAAKSGSFDLVDLILRHGASVNKTNSKKRTALMYSAKSGCSSIVSRLLDTGVCDVDAQDLEGNTALIMATKRGHNDVIEALLASDRCDICKQNKYGHTALHDAAKLGRMDLLAMMVLFHGADKDIQDKWKNTPLMYATLHGHSNCTALLLQSECNVNLANVGGRTALHTAAQNGHANIVSLLLQADASMDIRDLENNTPVLLAGRHQHYAIVKMLIEHGCDVTAKDPFGKTVFHFVAANGHLDLVQHLLQERAINPDEPDKNGNTALISAVHRNHVEIVRVLLQRNCRVNRNTRMGGQEFSIFSLALHNGSVALLRMLVEAGADARCYRDSARKGLVSSAILEDRALLDWLHQTVTMPKSLLRLCRDTIRLMLSCDLESELEEVTLPTKMKDLIMMKENCHSNI